jgi:mono/diheme cytochrome c family protein
MRRRADIGGAPTWRGRRATAASNRNPHSLISPMRLLLRILGGIVVVLVLTVLTVYAVSAQKLTRRISVKEPSITVPTDSATIERGKHLARAISKCVACHGDDLGGRVIIDDGLFARIVSANLTGGRGGFGFNLTAGGWVNAIRDGVAADGRPLFIMPSAMYHRLSDSDVAAIIAYVRSVPPIDREHPRPSFGPVGRVLLALGKLDASQEAFAIDHATKAPPSPPAGPTAEYGEYLVTVGGCRTCHGETLSGGPMANGPPSPRPPANITPEGLKAYDETAFFRALREGKRPDGTAIDSTGMPWTLTREMTDDEIRAVWSYLQTVPPKPYGNR